MASAQSFALNGVVAKAGVVRSAPVARGSSLSGSSFTGASVSAKSVVLPSAGRNARLEVSAKGYQTNLDTTVVEKFRKNEQDTGSTEVQIAKLTCRVLHLTAHLKEHKKDYATQRGLMMILGQRRRLLNYLYKDNRESYMAICADLGIKDKLSIV